MGKGSGRRPKNISDAELEKAWNSIFAGHPNEDDFANVKKDIVKRKEDVIKEDGYGNELPELKKFKDDPDRFYDETGDA
jgi:hypothetical protein